MIKSTPKTYFKPLCLMIMLICILVVTPVFVSAFEIDNRLNDEITKIGEAGYKDIEIKNFWGIGKTLWQGTLDYNTEGCSNNCKAISTITLSEKGVLLDDVLYERTYEDGTKGYVKIRKETIYANGKIYIPGEEVEAGTYEVILEGEKKSSWIVDWKFVYGKGIGEIIMHDWADWGSGGGFLNGLVAYYAFEETSGVVVDETGINNGSNDGADRGVTGKIGNAFDFETSETDGVDISDSASLDISGKQFSFTAWVKWEDSIIGSIMNKGFDGSKFPYRFGDMGGQTNIWGFFPPWQEMDYNLFNTGEWYFVAFIYNETNLGLYVNNALVQMVAETTDIPQNNINVTIGYDGSIDGPRDYMDGLIDELGMWNRSLSVDELSELWNDGDGLAFGNFSIGFITLNSPADNTETINSTIKFNATGTPTVGATVVNRTIILYNLDGTINQTNITLGLSGVTNTSVSTLTLTVGIYNWTARYCDSDGDCGVGRNRTLSIVPLIVNSQTFNNVTFSGAEETFTINFTLSSGSIISGAVLSYNNTNYTSNIFSVADKFQLINDISVPIVNINTNFSFNFLITVDGQIFETSLNQQQVSIINMTNCSDGGTLILNMTLLDEKTKTNLIGDIEINVQTLDKSSLTAAGFANISFNDVNFGAICFEPVEALDNLLLDAEIRYTSEGYATELYYIQGADLSDIPILLNLFDLNNNESTEFLVTYQDDNLIFVEGAILQLQRKYISEDLFEVVEAPLTSDSGTAIVHIDLDTNKYKVTIVKDGVVLDIFENIVFSCDNELSGQCTQKLLGQINPQNDIPIETLRDFSVAVTQANDTITTIFSIPSGVPSSVNVVMTQTDQFNNTNICNETVFSSAGAIECTIIPTIGDSFIELSIKKSGEIQSQKGYIVHEDFSLDFAGNNYFILFILMLSVIGMAFTSPEWIIINGVITMVLAGALYLATGVNFVVGLGNIIWLLIAAVILIIKISHQEDR